MLSPSIRLGTPLFSEAVPERASQSWSWNSEQYLSGLPNASAKSQRFSYAISQIAPLPLAVAVNRSFKSQIAARYAAFWHAIPQITLTSFLYTAPKSQRSKSCLQDANATKSQTLAFYKSQPLIFFSLVF